MTDEVEETQTMPEDNVETAPTTGDKVPPSQPEEKERMWNKAQIVEMMKRRVERSHNAFYKRYGVKDLNELDAKFALAGKYDELNAQFAPIQAKNAELLRENSFLRNNVNPERYNDIVTYFKGSGVEFSEEGLLEALKTHPEWLKPSTIPAPTATINSLGMEQSKPHTETEDEKFKRVFGF